VQARKVVPQILPWQFLSFAMLKSSGLLMSTSHSFSAALLGSTASHKACVLRSRRVLKSRVHYNHYNRFVFQVHGHSLEDAF
jgi:hypothetical protein